MAHQNINKVIKKKSNTLTKVEYDGKVTIYENNQPIAEIRPATIAPLQEQEISHLIRRKNMIR